MKKRPILNFLIETTKQNVVDINGFKINPLNLYALNNCLVRLQILQNGEYVDLSSEYYFYFGIDDSFNYDHNDLVFIDDFNVDSEWDDLSIGRISFILNLRTQEILNFIGQSKSKNVICELWSKSLEPKCLLYQQNCKLFNTLLTGFPNLCGIGNMEIGGSGICKFKVY